MEFEVQCTCMIQTNIDVIFQKIVVFVTCWLNCGNLDKQLLSHAME